MEIQSLATFMAIWRRSVTFLKQLGPAQLSLMAIVSLAYGIFAEPTQRGFLSYPFQWFLKSCGFVVCALACIRYVFIARRERVLHLQWPIKFMLASLAGLAAAVVGWFLVWLLIDPEGNNKALAWMQALGVFVTLTFFMAWGAIGDVFGAGRQDRVLHATGIALAAQVAVAFFAYSHATQPDAFADVGTPGLGAAIVGVYIASAVAPLVVGLLVFQATLLLAWIWTGVTGRRIQD